MKDKPHTSQLKLLRLDERGNEDGTWVFPLSQDVAYLGLTAAVSGDDLFVSSSWTQSGRVADRFLASCRLVPVDSTAAPGATRPPFSPEAE